jgi:hypothetical protein
MSDALPPSPRWEGFTLAQKYDWFNARPGAGVTEPTATALGGLGSGVGDSAGVLQRAMAGTGVSWQGQAATAAADSMNKAAHWARASGQVSGDGGGHVDGYGGSWTSTKNQIAAPVPEGSQTWWDHVTSVFGVQSDFDKNVAANHAADQRANEALTAHYNHSTAAVDSFADPTPVPPLTGRGPGLSNSSRPGATSPTGAHPGIGPGRGGATPTGGTSPHVGAGTGAGARARSATGPAGDAGGVAAGIGGSGKAGQLGGTGAGFGAREGGTTLPAGWTPPTPTNPGGATPAAPSAGGGVGGHGGATPVPLGEGGLGGSAGGVGEGIGKTLNPGLAPVRGSFLPHAGSGYAGGTPGVGRGVALSPRGGPGPGVGSRGETPARAGVSVGEPGVTRASGPGMGGMPPPGVGAGGRGQEREHRNHTFIPSDEPFVVSLDDDVTSAVITPDDDGWVPL